MALPRHRQIVHSGLFPCLEDSSYCPGLGDAPTRHKRRVGIINLTHSAETPCLNLVSNRRQKRCCASRIIVDPEMRFHEWSQQPSPDSPFVVSIIALLLDRKS